MKVRKIKIKASCGSGGCAYKPYYAPMGIKIIPIGNKNLVKKAA
jgi:hypothetical protein